MTLFLLRHAKSSWDAAGLDDHDRPLAPRGERAATLMGAYLAQAPTPPDLVLCSSSRRTRETLERVLAQLPRRPEVRVDRDLYLAGPRALLETIREVGDAPQAVLLVGHNPGVGELAVTLSGRGDEEGRRRMARKFPTGALATIRFAHRWSALTPGAGELLGFQTPKDLV